MYDVSKGHYIFKILICALLVFENFGLSRLIDKAKIINSYMLYI